MDLQTAETVEISDGSRWNVVRSSAEGPMPDADGVHADFCCTYA
jgi:hypothetical protein